MDKYLFYIYIIVLFFPLNVLSLDSISIASSDSDSTQTTAGKIYDPVVCGALSAVIPGGGQFYSGHYLKAGSFIALEVITAGVANFWYRESRNRKEEAGIFKERGGLYREAAKIYTKWSDSMKLIGNETLAAGYADSALKKTAQAKNNEEQAAILNYDAGDAACRMYNAVSWMLGGYIYNILDGIGCSRFFIDEGERNPVKAAYLSAIPCLGLGQIYNGSPSKAGMIFMTQVSMGVLAFNYHRLMKDAQIHISTSVDSSFNKDWEARRNSAFRNRNQWLWYSIAFYFYGILDAVVDAHLHDFKMKIRAYPDLVPELSALQIKIEGRF